MEYASYKSLFARSSSTLAEFIALIFGGEFPRTAAFDKEVATRIMALLRTELRQTNNLFTDTLGSSLMILRAIRDELNVLPLDEFPAQRFGGGSPAALRSFACELEATFDAVVEVGQERAETATRREKRQLNELRRLTAELPTLLLKGTSIDQDIQPCAVGAISAVIETNDETLINDAGIFETLENYAISSAGRNDVAGQLQLAKAFQSYSGISDIFAEQVRTAMLQPVNAVGRQSELWTTILDEEATRTIATNGIDSDQTFGFISSVIERAGRDGNDFGISVDLLEAANESLELRPPDNRLLPAENLTTSIRRSPYPNLQSLPAATSLEQFTERSSTF